MQYGYFDDENREYVITRPDTPLPWINYLGCEEYFGIVSNTAGGYSFYRDARLRRLTRYRYNNVPYDVGGRYIYLRDDASAEFWSPSWQPTRSELEKYECRHGMGYTTIGSQYKGIEARTRYFVPLGENLEIWQLTLTNRRNSAARLSAFSFIEFCLWDAQDDATNFQRNFSIGEVEIEDGIIYHKTEYRERRDHFAYFACSAPLAGFDTQRESFFGPYHGWQDPQAVAEGKSRNSIAHGWAPIGSHHVKLELAPGESRELIFVFGYQENPKDQKFDPPGSQVINKSRAKQTMARFLNPDAANRAFAELKSYWDCLLGLFQVDSPDVHTNRMVNIWNPYQCMATFNMSRSASFYESGIGRGLGFRDSNQDLLGFVHMVPARARERILDRQTEREEQRARPVVRARRVVAMRDEAPENRLCYVVAARRKLVEDDILTRHVRAIFVGRLLDVIERPRDEGVIRDPAPVEARIWLGVGPEAFRRGPWTSSTRNRRRGRRRQCGHVL